MRFRFILSHDESNSTVEITEPDAWKDCILKLERHEEFHSLVEYFEGSFIFYGSNGIVDGGANHIREWVRDYGLDTTIQIQISLTFDEVQFSEVFNGQLGIADLEELPNNKIRAPIIRDDRWSKFISRLDTPVNLQSLLNLDSEVTSEAPQVDLRLTSQKIRAVFYSKFDDGVAIPDPGNDFLDEYIQIEPPVVDLDEIAEKFTLSTTTNPEKPVWQWEMEFAGEYTWDIRIEASDHTIIGAGGGPLTGEANLYIQFNEDTPIAFTAVDHDDGVDESTVFTYQAMTVLTPGTIVRIYGLVNATLSGQFYIWGELNTPIEVFFVKRPPSGSENPSYFSVVANTTFPETRSHAFLIHDAAGYIIDRTTGEEGIFYSELLGSQYTQYRQYISDGCAWRYALVRGLQLRGYNLNHKPFFQSFNQWWKGANPILNLSLSYETVQIPYIIDVSPDVNLIEPLANWSDSPGAGWDYGTFGHPFASVNGGGGIEPYTVGEAVFNEDQPYQIDTTLFIQTTGSSTPDCTITYAILDSVFNELATREFQYIGPGTKTESFILIPIGVGSYFGVKIVNNTPIDTKNFEVTYAFSEESLIGYNQETVIRIEKKSDWYDDSEGTSIDFSNVREITRKFDNDRIFNRVGVGYTNWESEDISGIDDPQTKKNYHTRFKKAGKGIDLYSEFIAASLLFEQARRTSRIKSSDYKHDNSTFIIALNDVPQDESPDISPDILTFIPELDENFTLIENLDNADTRYNLRLTPERNLLRWQDFLQGALQSYLGSFFTFSSGEGNYDVVTTMDPEGCPGDFEGMSLDGKGDIMVEDNYLHLPELYEMTIPMDWTEYQIIQANRKKPIGISLSDSGHVAMFIKTLQFHPVKGNCEILAWSKEYLDLNYFEDHTPMQECVGVGPGGGVGPGEDCDNAITDSEGNILTDEFGECIFEGDSESDGIGLDFPLDHPF